MKYLKKVLIIQSFFIVIFVIFYVSNFAISILNDNTINVISKSKEFYLGGEACGIKLLASGVLVMENDREDSKLKVGDIILSVNGEEINTSKRLEEIVSQSGGSGINLVLMRNTQEKEINIVPNYDSITNKYMLNVWVKDSSAGVGTITFYEKNSMMFAALGHGVTETEKNYIVPIETGAITFTSIYNIKKGIANQPGEIRGTVSSRIIGSIIKNTDKGIYGRITTKDYLNDKEKIELLEKSRIKEGKAKIVSSVNYGKKDYYDIEIEKVMLNSKGNKNMIIKIVDSRLINLTGGIIQGMSGSPIIQDGKLVGAVTFVLLNDPTTGYGVFIENMLEDMNNI